ncbi:hypothetical protein niasHT_019082 [Heterodera trifolii]|uniref:Protein-tyrosine phosphatase n=1 Tax=Heterodera trifolii TaxID=157864 RepID=A0ABD2LAU5_9BILA
MSGAGSGRQKRGQTEAPRRPTRRQSTQRPRQAGTQQQPGRATTPQEQSVLAPAPTLRRWEDTAEFFFALERFVNDTTPRVISTGRPRTTKWLMRFANNQIVVKFMREHHVEGALYRTDLIVGAPQMRQGHLRVQHFHWRQWPDRGVPHSDLAPLRLLYHVIGVPRAVVHCSAGIGRTGTLVAVYLANQTLHLGQPLNIFALIRDLRRQRSQSIQTLDQYLYIYFVILRYAQNKASKLNINVNALNALVQALNSTMRRG